MDDPRVWGVWGLWKCPNDHYEVADAFLPAKGSYRTCGRCRERLVRIRKGVYVKDDMLHELQASVNAAMNLSTDRQRVE